MPDLADIAHDLAETALDTLQDRKGFDDWWDMLDGGVKDEIRELMIEKMLPRLRDLQSAT